MIDVKEAVQTAVKYFKDLYKAEGFQDILLEEVDFDHGKNVWLITLGFSRYTSTIEPLGGYERRYKIFEVSAKTGKVLSMKIRTVEHA